MALRIICERERAIWVFEPEEYWSITARLDAGTPPPFAARLVKKNGRKLTIPDGDTTRAILDELEGQPLIVESYNFV